MASARTPPQSMPRAPPARTSEASQAAALGGGKPAGDDAGHIGQSAGLAGAEEEADEQEGEEARAGGGEGGEERPRDGDAGEHGASADAVAPVSQGHLEQAVGQSEGH